jgi:methyltransferase-like protein
MAIFSKNLSISKAILDKLEETYPNTLPLDQIQIEELRFLQGQQSVIAFFRSLYEETLEEN